MDNVKNSIIWSSFERISVQGTQFILSIIIARLVGPRDFGLIAMLTIFLAIAQVFTDSGFGNALIQKKDKSEIDYATVFYFNIGIATVIYVILFLSAPLIAKFYKEPILSSVTRWSSLNLILSAICLIQRTKLRINSNFKKIGIIAFFAVIISGAIGLSLAYFGFGVWALVFQSVSFQLIQALLFWITSKWYPLIAFSWTSFKTLFSFGSKILASGLLHSIYLNLYSLLIGRFYNASEVGYYNRASTISQYIPTNLINIIINVIYPLQCKHQDDNKWLVTSFSKYLRITTFIVFSIMIYISVMARPLVHLILSNEWDSSAPLISILSIAYMWLVFGSLNNYIINAKGRSDLYLKAELLKKSIAIIILIISLPFGITILSYGLLLYYVIDTIIITGFTKKILDIGLYWQMKQIFPIIACCICATIPALITSYLFKISWHSLFIGSVLYWGSFIVVCHVANIYELNLIINTIRKYLKL